MIVITNQNHSHFLTLFLRNNISSTYLWVQIQFRTTYLKCEFHPNFCLQPLASNMLLLVDYWPLLLVMDIFVYGSLTLVLLFSWTIGHCYCLWAIDHSIIILHGPLVIVVYQPLTMVLFFFMDPWPLLLFMDIVVCGSLTMLLLFFVDHSPLLLFMDMFWTSLKNVHQLKNLNKMQPKDCLLIS